MIHSKISFIYSFSKKFIFAIITVISSTSFAKHCFFGDSGHNNKGQRDVAMLLEKRGCRYIYHLGDIVYPSGIKSFNDAKVKTHFLNHYQNLLNQGSTIYLTVGNHDALGKKSAWIDVAKQNKGIHFPNLYYSTISQRAVCVVALDTNSISNDQISFLKNVDLDNCKYKILIGHHPYLSSGQHGDSSGSRKRFFEEYVIGKFDAYISGHDHNLSYEGVIKGTHFAVSGSGGTLRPVKKKRVFAESKLGILELELKRFDAKWTFVDVNHNELFGF